MKPSDFIKGKVLEWIDKAESDLKSAEILLNHPEPPTAIVCYHCQQAAEKYLKGFLTYHQIDFMKTHDLDYLYKLANPKINISSSKTDLLSLNKYAIEARYPMDIPIHYSIEEAKKALEKAKAITCFIKSNLDLLL